MTPFYLTTGSGIKVRAGGSLLNMGCISLTYAIILLEGCQLMFLVTARRSQMVAWTVFVQP